MPSSTGEARIVFARIPAASYVDDPVIFIKLDSKIVEPYAAILLERVEFRWLLKESDQFCSACHLLYRRNERLCVGNSLFVLGIPPTNKRYFTLTIETNDEPHVDTGFQNKELN